MPKKTYTKNCLQNVDLAERFPIKTKYISLCRFDQNWSRFHKSIHHQYNSIHYHCNRLVVKKNKPQDHKNTSNTLTLHCMARLGRFLTLLIFHLYSWFLVIMNEIHLLFYYHDYSLYRVDSGSPSLALRVRVGNQGGMMCFPPNYQTSDKQRIFQGKENFSFGIYPLKRGNTFSLRKKCFAYFVEISTLQFFVWAVSCNSWKSVSDNLISPS